MIEQMAGNLLKQDKEAVTTLFKVAIPELRDITFKSCEGLESEIEIRLYSEGGKVLAKRTARGEGQSHKVAFAQGTGPRESGAKSLFDWFSEVCDSSKPLKKKTLTVTAIQSEGKSVAEWRILNAWPCRWVAPLLSQDFSGLTMEYVTFAHEGITRIK